MKVISTIGNIIERCLGIISNFFLIFVVIAICVEVFCRFVLGFSTIGSEIAKLLWIWAAYLVIGIVTRYDEHIAVDAIKSRFSKNISNIHNVISHVLALYFSVMVGWGAFQMVMNYKSTGAMMPSALDLPEWIVRSCVFIGLFILSFFTIEKLITSITILHDNQNNKIIN